MSTVINKNYFDNILVKYDLIPIEKIFESIEGLYINNKFDFSKIHDKIKGNKPLIIINMKNYIIENKKNGNKLLKKK